MTEPQWTGKGRELMPGIILEWLEQMNEKAEPRLMDTGTFYVEVKVCRFCDQPIEKTPGRYLGLPWVHSGTKSIYCHDEPGWGQ